MEENTQATDDLKEKFGDRLISLVKEYDFNVFEFVKHEIRNVILHLKNEEGFIYLTTMCGAHFPDNDPSREFCIIYQLHNFVTNERIRLKVFMPRDDMKMPTITDIFDAANWMEREAYDFYGFTFEGHPNLIRILNMEEMNYFPLRKEYPLEDLARGDKEDKFFGR